MQIEIKDDKVLVEMSELEARILANYMYDSYMMGAPIPAPINYFRHFIRTSIGIKYTYQEVQSLK